MKVREVLQEVSAWFADTQQAIMNFELMDLQLWFWFGALVLGAIALIRALVIHHPEPTMKALDKIFDTVSAVHAWWIRTGKDR